MKIDYLELINEIANYKKGEELDVLRDVYDQLEEAGIEGIKNDRSSWSKPNASRSFKTKCIVRRQVAQHVPWRT